MLTGKLLTAADQNMAWNLNAYADVYVQQFSVTSQEAIPEGLFFKPDGTRMYIVGSAGDEVNEFSLSTPWDITTASYVRVFSVASQDTSPEGLFFKPDGTAMYIAGNINDSIYQYALSSAWDISSASYVRSFSIASQETAPADVFFKPDGTKMYVLGDAGNDVNEYALSSAWDISTASYVQVFSVGSQDTSPSGLFFTSDGLGMYVVGMVNNSVYQYTLSSAWDISTTSYVRTLSIATAETSPTGLYFSPDGLQLYVVGAEADSVSRFLLSSPWDISTAKLPTSFTTSSQSSGGRAVFFKPDGTVMYRVATGNDAVYEYSLSSAWDITTSSFVRSVSVASQDTTPTGLFFKPDGTKMYMVGSASDLVREYTLSTAWNVSTATYTQGFSVATQEGAATALQFSSDGTKMYVIGTLGDDVNEYSLSSAWDISTASYVQIFSVASQETVPNALFFKPDGTAFYIGGDSLKLHQYSLTTAWNVSTSSYSGQSFSYEPSGPAGSTAVFFRDTGSRLFIGSTAILYQFSL